MFVSHFFMTFEASFLFQEAELIILLSELFIWIIARTKREKIRHTDNETFQHTGDKLENFLADDNQNYCFFPHL